MAQIDTHTEAHGDSMTKSAQWGQFSENKSFFGYVYKIV